MTTPPQFLVVKAPDASGQAMAALARAAAEDRGMVVAAAPRDGVEVLEPGSPHTATLIARFASEEDLRRAWVAPATERALAELGADGELVALSIGGLPPEGVPDAPFPTAASVEVPEAAGPPAWMLVEGGFTDQEAGQRYNEVIWPMLRERGAYYAAVVFGAGVTSLRGRWDEAVFAISRWPSLEAAHDFWYGERYQDVAVPIRTGKGAFSVLLLSGREG